MRFRMNIFVFVSMGYQQMKIILIAKHNLSKHNLTSNDANKLIRYGLIFRSVDWLFITNSLKGHVYFPKLLFNNVKSIEKIKSYGARASEYYWMNTNNEKHDFEYYERLKITSYCPFKFSTFPFDTHNCDLTVGSGAGSISYVKLLKITVIYQKLKSNDKIIPIESNDTDGPFEIKAESIKPFLIDNNGLDFSYTGVKIIFKRNTFGLLIGRFYGPTAMFSAFSILSYNINIDMVMLIEICSHI